MMGNVKLHRGTKMPRTVPLIELCRLPCGHAVRVSQGSAGVQIDFDYDHNSALSRRQSRFWASLCGQGCRDRGFEAAVYRNGSYVIGLTWHPI